MFPVMALYGAFWQVLENVCFAPAFVLPFLAWWALTRARGDSARWLLVLGRLTPTSSSGRARSRKTCGQDVGKRRNGRSGETKPLTRRLNFSQRIRGLSVPGPRLELGRPSRVSGF